MAFSTKPCYRLSQIFATKQKEEEGDSKNCLMWTEEQYEDADFLSPTFCQVCVKSPSDIKVEPPETPAGIEPPNGLRSVILAGTSYT